MPQNEGRDRDLDWDLPGTHLSVCLIYKPKDIPRRKGLVQHTATHLCLIRNRDILPRDSMLAGIPQAWEQKLKKTWAGLREEIPAMP